jgi:enoyl-CoA hydratase/carnithine racemase
VRSIELDDGTLLYRERVNGGETVMRFDPASGKAVPAFDHASLVEGALETAREIAGKSPLAVWGTKVAMNYARDHSVADGLNYVATWNAAMLLSNDLQEAMMANMGKRKPAFKD